MNSIIPKLLNLQNVIILSIILASCAGKKKHGNSSLQVLSINEIDVENTNIASSTCIKDHYYIPLETIQDKNIIGKVDKVLFYDKKIFLLDRRISQAVFAFTEDGNFLFKIDKIGSGPGEFKDPQDMVIDPKTNQLIIYCRKNRKLSFYSLMGDLIKEQRIEVDFRSFEINNKQHLFFTHSIYNYLEKTGELPYDFIVMDTSGKLQNKQFYNNMKVGKSGLVISHNMYFTRYNDELYVSWIFNDTIYKITHDNIAVPYCRFDFGHHSMSDEYLRSKENCMYVYEDIVNGLYWCKYGPVQTTEKLHLVRISAGRTGDYNNGFYNVLFTKNFQTAFIYQTIDNELDDGTFEFPISTYNDYFVSVLYPEELIYRKEESGTSGPVILKGIESSINKFDNPILLFTKFSIDEKI